MSATLTTATAKKITALLNTESLVAPFADTSVKVAVLSEFFVEHSISPKCEEQPSFVQPALFDSKVEENALSMDLKFALLCELIDGHFDSPYLAVHLSAVQQSPLAHLNDGGLNWTLLRLPQLHEHSPQLYSVHCPSVEEHLHSHVPLTSSLLPGLLPGLSPPREVHAPLLEHVAHVLLISLQQFELLPHKPDVPENAKKKWNK